MFPIIGALLGGAGGAGALGGLMGGAAGGGAMAGGSLLSSLMGGGGLSSLFSSLGSLFGGGQQGQGADQTNQLLGDIKDMLSQLVDGMGQGQGQGGCCGGGQGVGGGHGGPGGPGGSHGGPDGPGWGPKPEPECGCDGPAWDGQDKSPSLDREQSAARLLEQAKDAKTPEEKRELIQMALDMLGEGKGKGDCPGKDGNSYDKDIADQAQKMLDKIDDSCLSDCAKSDAMDSVIDMLQNEGGVDGKPAGNDSNGDGWHNGADHDCGDVRPLPWFGHHVMHHEHDHR